MKAAPHPFERHYTWLVRLPRTVKRLILGVCDFVGLSFCIAFAFTIWPVGLIGATERLLWLFPSIPVAAVLLFAATGLYRSVVRYIGLRTLVTIGLDVTLLTLLYALLLDAVEAKDIPYSVPVAFWMASILAVGGSRVLAQAILNFLSRRSQSKEPIVLYGAGAAGRQSAVALQLGGEYHPVAFFDDDASLHGMFMHGIPVYPPARIDEIIARHDVAHVLIAIPSIGHAHRRRIVERLEGVAVHVKTLPGLADLITGKARVDELRDLEIEDLLGREPIVPDGALMRRKITGMNVLVTGAGGSIGGELCRQIVRQSPKRLLILDISEPSLFLLERELRDIVAQCGVEVEIIPFLGNVQDRQRLVRIMTSFDVQTVYHAAAYKHVPLVEHNVIEGIQNNVFGTLHCAEAAIEAKVKTFVLISTDKAVRPANVMGASKRMAEIVLQGLSERVDGTCFTMVRFGNVLGSSGSVVPLFREQIKAGGPITVTHADVTRYFMTISEAAELVIQAGAMGKGGDVFVLDMGKPVKIYDVARRMALLMGLQIMDDDHPDGDIRIEFIGLRPGEKLYEELLIGDSVRGTSHPRIMRAEEPSFTWAEVDGVLRQMAEASRAADYKWIQQMLVDVVSGYTPNAEVVDPIWLSDRAGEELDDALAKLTPDKLH